MADGEHKHGEMDITAQERAFEGFVRYSKNAVIVIILLLIFLAFVNV